MESSYQTTINPIHQTDFEIHQNIKHPYLINLTQITSASNSTPKSDLSKLPVAEGHLDNTKSYTLPDNNKISINNKVLLKDLNEIPFRRTIISSIPANPKPDFEQILILKVCPVLITLFQLRDKYIFYNNFNLQHPLDFALRGERSTPIIEDLKNPQLSWKIIAGVTCFFNGSTKINSSSISAEEYFSDLHILIKSLHELPNKIFCSSRLEALRTKFKTHLMWNQDRELLDITLKKSKDFHNTTKVDNHIHLVGAMHQKHLQKFIKSKLAKFPNEIVIKKNDELLTLNQIFDSLQITSEDLTADALDVYCDHKVFQRFDRFNLKFNPLGAPMLREIFLKTDNFIKGKYFAELTKEVISQLEIEKHTLCEYRVSVYGRNPDEWQKLSVWFNTFQLKSKRVKWLIQVPRLYSLYKSSNQINSFADILNNLFSPVIEASLDPEQHPDIHNFLQEIVGFDSVDDESKNEKISAYKNYKTVAPEDWTCTENPPYSYWCFYMYVNIFCINQLRHARGFNTFAFRPHCGEAGSINHLASAYLTAHSVNHGIELKNSPVLEYLYYLAQIGVSVSPFSNNKLFVKFGENPLLRFFEEGLNVTVSSDAPLMFHLTREPLVEEYSAVKQAFGMSEVSMCELARNSVLQSGFERERKRKWVGEGFLGGDEKDGQGKMNFSGIRWIYRCEVYREEVGFVWRYDEG